MGDLWFPGADRSRKAFIDGGSIFDEERPKCVWHDTETSGVPSYSTGFFPHFTIHGNKVYQHIPLNRAARALRNEPGGVQTNRHNVVQIEVCGFANRVRFVPVMRELAQWLKREHGIPLETIAEWLPFDASFGHTRARMTFQGWEAFSGHCGHMHVPENDHGDPGWPFPIADIIRSDDSDMPLNAADKEYISEEITRQLYRALLVLMTGNGNAIFNANSTPALFADGADDLSEIDESIKALASLHTPLS